MVHQSNSHYHLFSSKNNNIVKKCEIKCRQSRERKCSVHNAYASYFHKSPWIVEYIGMEEIIYRNEEGVEGGQLDNLFQDWCEGAG